MNSILHCALNKKYNKNPDGSRDLFLPPLKDNCHKLFPFFGNLSLTIIVVGSQRQCFTSPLWKREAERSSQRFCSPSNQKLAVFSTGISGAPLIVFAVNLNTLFKPKWWLNGLADAPPWLPGALREQVDWQQVDSLAWAGYEITWYHLSCILFNRCQHSNVFYQKELIINQMIGFTWTGEKKGILCNVRIISYDSKSLREIYVTKYKTVTKTK